jgi:hypothetical protein
MHHSRSDGFCIVRYDPATGEIRYLDRSGTARETSDEIMIYDSAREATNMLATFATYGSNRKGTNGGLQFALEVRKISRVVNVGGRPVNSLATRPLPMKRHAK